jgi:hypothetical protein
LGEGARVGQGESISGGTGRLVTGQARALACGD